MRLTWTTRNGRKRVVKSPLAKFLILALLWFPLMLICFVIHVPIYLVNGRGFYEKGERAFNPPGWASSTAPAIYATVLILAGAAIT